MEHQIRFPHLGIVLKNVGDGINIGGFEIKYYGMIIATGFLLGLIVSYYAAKHENKFDPELVFDYLITMIIPAIVGARLYYVIFSWDYYKNHLSEIIQIRNGGLAIYGGVIAGAITLYTFWILLPFSGGNISKEKAVLLLFLIRSMTFIF